MNKTPLAVKFFSYAGILPIFIGVIGSFDLSIINNKLNIFLVEFGLIFSAIILSFLGGCLFIFEIHFKSKIDFRGVLISMFPSIWAVFSLNLPMTGFLIAIGFLATLERERYLSKTIKPKQ